MTMYVLGLVECQGKFLSVLKQKGPEAIVGKLNGIGGKRDPGEHVLVCMARELIEETGHSITLSWRGVLRGDGWKMDIFYRKIDEFLEVKEVNDVGEPLAWVAQAELFERGVPNLRWIVPLCQQNISFSAEENE